MKKNVLKKMMVSLILVVSGVMSNAQTQTWGEIYVEPYFTYDIIDYKFLNDFAYAVSKYSSQHRIHKSKDGGKTWTIETAPYCPSGNFLDAFNRVAYFDSLNAVYKFYNVLDKKALYYKTTDGGANFTFLSDTAFSAYTAAGGVGNEFTFLNSNVWYGKTRVMRNSDSKIMDLIYITTDGGLTWKDVSQAVLDAGSGDLVIDVEFTSASVGYISSGNGTFLKTSDGGVSWNSPNSTINNVGSGIGYGWLHFIDDNNGYYARLTGSWDLFDTLYVTSDGGNSFTSTNLNGQVIWNDYVGNDPNYDVKMQYISSIDFLDKDNGVIVGTHNNDVNLILRTSDAGQTWVQDSLIDSIAGNTYGGGRCSNAQFVNQNSVFATFTGKIVGFGDGFATSNPNNPNSIKTIENANAKLYPNPLLNGQLNIKVDGDYNVNIYNVNGQLIVSAKNQIENSTIDLRNVQSSIYSVQIISNSFITTKKLVIK